MKEDIPEREEQVTLYEEIEETVRNGNFQETSSEDKESDEESEIIVSKEIILKRKDMKLYSKEKNIFMEI
jgi:hypothetical protein